MTATEFLAHFAAAHSRCPFSLQPNGSIRDERGRCPLVAVAVHLRVRGHQYFSNETEGLAAAILELSGMDGFEIGLASDIEISHGPSAESVGWIRFRMLAVIAAPEPVREVDQYDIWLTRPDSQDFESIGEASCLCRVSADANYRQVADAQAVRNPKWSGGEVRVCDTEGRVVYRRLIGTK